MNNYVFRLELEFDPFDPSAENHGFFGGGERQLLLDRLIEQGLNNNSLMTVTGGSGSGKTSLAREFCNSLENEAQCVLVQGALFMNQAQFIEALLSQLPIDSFADSTQGVIVEVRQFAARLELDASALMLVVDDAHEIASEVLEIIAALLDDSVGVHVCLLGEAQLNNMLHSALPDELLDRLCEFSLKQFGSEDTLAYVRFKLACAGYDQDLPLTSAELVHIQGIADGIPGAINTEVARALTAIPASTDTAAAQKSWLIPGWRYWIATAALLLLLLGAIMSTDSEPDASVEIAAGASAEESMEAAVEPASVASSSDSQAGVARQQISIPTAFVAEPVAMPVTVSNALGAVSPETLPEQAALAASEVAAGVAPMPDPVKAEVASNAEAGSLTSEPGTKAVPVLPAVRHSGFEQQLLAFAPGSFTVQVMASSAEAKVKQFVADTMVPQPKGYFETRYRGQPWFVVVAGNYGSRTAATDSIQQLPESLRSLQPWVRNLADIQDAIRLLGPAP